MQTLKESSGTQDEKWLAQQQQALPSYLIQRGVIATNYSLQIDGKQQKYIGSADKIADYITKKIKDEQKKNLEYAKELEKNIKSAIKSSETDEETKEQLRTILPELEKITAQPKNIPNAGMQLVKISQMVCGIVANPISGVSNIATGYLKGSASKVSKTLLTLYGLTTGFLGFINLIGRAANAGKGVILIQNTTAKIILSPTSYSIGALGGAQAAAYTPLTMVLSPLIGVTSIYMMAGKNMALKDLRQNVESLKYRCTCGLCEKGLEFIIDRSDGLACRIALTATVVGAFPVAAYTAIRKIKHKLQGEDSKKHQVAKALWVNAKPEGVMDEDGNIIIEREGCPRAILIIGTLYGEFKKGTTFTRTIATILAQDGINKIKGMID